MRKLRIMNNNDNAYLEKLITDYQKKYFKEIEQDIIQIFQEAIDQTIYDAYTPNTYKRTYMFRDSVRCHYDYKNNVLYVYSDINTGYYSAVDGRDVTPAISYWLQEGHSDGTGIDNQYHNYQGRNYLEKAEKMIKEKYPDLKLKIVNDSPPTV